MPENSLLYNAYKESKILDSRNINSWFSNANYLCKKIDIVWSKCKSMKTTTLKKQLKINMRQGFLHYWSMKRKESCKSGKLTTYFYIKTNFEFEKYLSLKKFEHRKNICKFRISAHNLRIESGRYGKITNKERQKTTLCVTSVDFGSVFPLAEHRGAAKKGRRRLFLGIRKKQFFLKKKT